MADRRVLDAQVLYSLKNYEEAATILLDVVEKYPNTRAHDDALFLLGESLFQARDYYSSRHYLRRSRKNTGSKPEQQALQRLVEISLRTGDYDNVDGYLARCRTCRREAMEPAMPYVRGKYYYFRGRLDDAALTCSRRSRRRTPYYFQARYFMATIQVQEGRPGRAPVSTSTRC